MRNCLKEVLQRNNNSIHILTIHKGASNDNYGDEYLSVNIYWEITMLPVLGTGWYHQIFWRWKDRKDMYL